MKIKLITVGKLKEAFLKDGVAEYCKRLKRFTKLEMVELADEKIPENASQVEKDIILKKEADKINSKIGERDFVVCLAIEGTQFPSEEFSKRLVDAMIYGYSDIAFIIGGSLGLDNSVKKRANILMSFGKLTLPHQLMKLVLVEQIYRAFMIQQGSSYHK